MGWFNEARARAITIINQFVLATDHANRTYQEDKISEHEIGVLYFNAKEGLDKLGLPTNKYVS